MGIGATSTSGFRPGRSGRSSQSGVGGVSGVELSASPVTTIVDNDMDGKGGKRFGAGAGSVSLSASFGQPVNHGRENAVENNWDTLGRKAAR